MSKPHCEDWGCLVEASKRNRTEGHLRSPEMMEVTSGAVLGLNLGKQHMQLE